MPQPREEDLFAESTMTFGEHLEELRICLFRALIGLVAGFLVGLIFGGDVVAFIQNPLRNALREYKQQQNEQLLTNLREQGKLPPGELEQYEYLVTRQGLVAEEVLVDPDEVRRQLGYPEGTATPPDASSDGRSLADDNTQSQREDATGEPRSGADRGGTAAGGSDDGPPMLTKDDLVPLFLWRPVEDAIEVTSLSAHEPFSIYIKASFVLGAILASPWVFYQIWMFVAAGLYPHERKYVHWFLPMSLGLFFAGAALAFFFVFEPVLQFLFMFNSWLGIEQDIRISEWLGFVLILPLGFGVAFQLPLVMLFLERIGIFDVEAYLSKWRIAVLMIFVLGMMLTPADPYSMLLMAIPLTFLYFGGVLLCRYMPRVKNPYSEWGDQE